MRYVPSKSVTILFLALSVLIAYSVYFYYDNFAGCNVRIFSDTVAYSVELKHKDRFKSLLNSFQPCRDNAYSVYPSQQSTENFAVTQIEYVFVNGEQTNKFNQSDGTTDFSWDIRIDKENKKATAFIHLNDLGLDKSQESMRVMNVLIMVTHFMLKNSIDVSDLNSEFNSLDSLGLEYAYQNI